MHINHHYHVNEKKKKFRRKKTTLNSLFLGIVVDELESLLEYAPVGPRYSNNVLQTLKLLLKRPPPKGRKLLIIATATYRDILEQLGILTSFSKVIHLSNMNSGSEILEVLNKVKHCFTDSEMKYLEKELRNKK